MMHPGFTGLISNTDPFKLEEILAIRGEVGALSRIARNRERTNLLCNRLLEISNLGTAAASYAVDVTDRIREQQRGAVVSTDKPNPSCFAGVDTTIIASIVERAFQLDPLD